MIDVRHILGSRVPETGGLPCHTWLLCMWLMCLWLHVMWK